MVTTELGACEWFVWDLRRSNLIDRGRLDQVISEFLQQYPRAEPAAETARAGRIGDELIALDAHGKFALDCLNGRVHDIDDELVHGAHPVAIGAGAAAARFSAKNRAIATRPSLSTPLSTPLPPKLSPPCRAAASASSASMQPPAADANSRR